MCVCGVFTIALSMGQIKRVLINVLCILCVSVCVCAHLEIDKRRMLPLININYSWRALSTRCLYTCGIKIC